MDELGTEVYVCLQLMFIVRSSVTQRWAYTAADWLFYTVLAKCIGDNTERQ